jgi:hypothetical protein
VRLLGRIPGPWQFALDGEVFRQDASERLRLSGWALHPEFSIRKVVLQRDGREIASAAPSILRPKVKAAHPNRPGSDHAGFELEVDSPPPGRILLSLEGEDGQAETAAELELVLEDQPKLIFMHIAKAAGSTVNAFFASHYARGRYLVHIESEKAWREAPKSLREFDFLSGHVSLPSLKRRLGIENFRLVTVVREPYAQLISHLAWVRRLSDAGEEYRFHRHPEYVQAFSRKLAGHDLANPGELKTLIRSLNDLERQLVDNCQVRYFTRVEAGFSVSEGDLRQARVAVREFDRIGTAEDLDAFMAGVAADMGWPAPRPVKRENVTRDFYGLERAGMRVRAALKPLVRYDLQLYELVRRTAVPKGPAGR